MPEGIIAEVDGGFATIDFIDRSLRGPGLAKLLEIGGPETVETLTRSGPRKKYRVPEGNAREAGLLDGDGDVAVVGDTGAADSLAGAASTGVSPFAGSKNTWGTGREPLADPEVAADEDDDDLADLPVEGDDVVDAPSEDWKLDDLRAYARDKGIDLDGARTKVDVLARIKEAE